MKKIYSIFLIFIAALSSCEPIENRNSIGGYITADELEIYAQPIVVNGKSSNKVVLTCKSPVLSHWDYGVGDSYSSSDTIKLLFTGENQIMFTGLNPDGTKIQKSLTVNVEVLSDPVPTEWSYLFGNGEKEWTWSSTFKNKFGVQVCFGNGGYKSDQLIAWWKMDINSQTLTDAAGTDGKNAKMKFSKNGVKFTKTTNDGIVYEGKFMIDMTKKTYVSEGVWSIGKLYIKGEPNLTILRGWGDNLVPKKEFDIIALTPNQLQLSEVPPAGTAAWKGVLGWAFDAIK